jgi:3-(3-hydroxy-phenyl)propionate hydroxylase
MKPHIASEIHSNGYRLPVYHTRRAEDLDLPKVRRVPVIVAGGGLSGLAFAVDLASRGVRCIVLDDDDTVGVRGASSRGIAYARKTLEILTRVGAARPVLDKGVTWSVGRTLDLDAELFRFDLAAGSRASLPPFVNIQQFYVEAALVDRAYELGVDLRWKNEVRTLQPHSDHARLTVDTPEGSYEIEAEWFVDATGVNSKLRAPAGIPVDTQKGVDRWCICDVRFETQWPCERWTWIRAAFNGGRAVWQHPMPDAVWRLDYQLADNDESVVDEARARAMVMAHVGPEAKFDVVWAGPWTYRNQLARQFRNGRVFVVGDAAHAFSPFGGRGGNSGVQDAENLAWKMALVLAGKAPEALLDTYDSERRAAAKLNIEVTSDTMRFLKPANLLRRSIRNAILGLARRHASMRRFVDTGKLSVAFTYPAAPWLTHGGQSLPDLRLSSPSGEVGLLADLTAGPVAGLVLDFCSNAASARELRERVTASCPALRYRRVAAQPQGDELMDDATLRAEAGMPAQGDAALLVRPDGHVCALALGAQRPRIESDVAAMLQATPGTSASAPRRSTFLTEQRS